MVCIYLYIIPYTKEDSAPITLDPQTTETFTFGRDRGSNLAIDHASCSKNHATVTFKTHNGAKVYVPFASPPFFLFSPNSNFFYRPHLTDLGSTNGTKLNGTQIQAHKATPLKGGDTVVFGASTREYTFLQKD